MEKVYENMDKAVAQGERAAQIIRSLRQFIEKGETERARLDVNEIVDEACTMALVGTRNDGFRITSEMAVDLPPIMANKIQIQQVVVNLLRNSVDAMSGDWVWREIRVATSLNGDDGVEIMVSDTGSGLPEIVAKQLFKPFVTTKADGMGVGLSICRSIVEDHGGRLWTEPNPGGGTIFAFNIAVAALEENMDA